MKKHIWTVMILIFAIIFIGSGVWLIVIFNEYNVAENTYEDAVSEFFAAADESGVTLEATTVERQDTFSERMNGWYNNLIGQELEAYDTGEVIEFVEDVPYAAPDPPKPFDMNVDFAALKAINSEVYAWIYIPDTTVCYPVVQHSDNEYYLTHTYKNAVNKSGSIYIDSRCANDFSSRNTVLFGHNMLNNTMFSALTKYAAQSYYNAHPYIYIITESGVTIYEIFSAYTTPADGRAYSVLLDYDPIYQDFLNEITESSKITTNIVPTIDDKILTLSTCTVDEGVRFIINARR